MNEKQQNVGVIPRGRPKTLMSIVETQHFASHKKTNNTGEQKDVPQSHINLWF